MAKEILKWASKYRGEKDHMWLVFQLESIFTKHSVFFLMTRSICVHGTIFITFMKGWIGIKTHDFHFLSFSFQFIKEEANTVYFQNIHVRASQILSSCKSDVNMIYRYASSKCGYLSVSVVNIQIKAHTQWQDRAGRYTCFQEVTYFKSTAETKCPECQLVQSIAFNIWWLVLS